MNAVADKTWFGQPRGLTILFLTQMWEIFSYYGMRTLLVYYMTKQLMFAQEKSSLVYGTYTALAYFTPILGGAVADRWLGKRRSVIIGASVMAIGHFLMASESLLYFALAAIAIGNGLFLPSLPSQIDDLYAKDDPRRGSSFAYRSSIWLGRLGRNRPLPSAIAASAKYSSDSDAIRKCPMDMITAPMITARLRPSQRSETMPPRIGVK